MEIDDIARVCHEANRALCEINWDHSQSPWEIAPQWQKESAVNGVRFHLANPDATPEQSHENWMKEKIQDGWVYGERKNATAKTHPCLRPYNELPEDQQMKDHMFRAIVHTLKPFLVKTQPEDGSAT